MKSGKIFFIFTLACALLSFVRLPEARGQLNEANMESATREVDHSMREEADKELESPPPKPPDIEIEGEKGIKGADED